MLDGVDEWGFRKIDGLLEDGTKIIIISGGQVYEIHVDAISQNLATATRECMFNIAKNASVASQSLTASETTFNILKGAITQPLASVVIEVVTGIIEIFKDAIATAKATFTLESTFNISPEANVKMLAEVILAKEGEIKVTKLFLIIGDLAIQIQGS
jgi:hypothetical protein